MARARSQRAPASGPCRGSDGRIEGVESALSAASARIGYPIMIKAAAGGGSRGIRVADTPAELRKANSGGDRGSQRGVLRRRRSLRLERFVAWARHIEVQVLGDGKDVIHLYASANAPCSGVDRKCGRKRLA